MLYNSPASPPQNFNQSGPIMGYGQGLYFNDKFLYYINNIYIIIPIVFIIVAFTNILANSI